jgi:cobalt/nickel transport system ATP-binding protein
MIQIKNVVKNFSDKVLMYPDIVANQGQCVLLCGNTGSGKTTFCEIVAGFLKADTAEITINDTPPKNIFLHLHYMSQFPENNLIGPSASDDLSFWFDEAIERGGRTADRVSICEGSHHDTTTKEVAIQAALARFKLSPIASQPVWKLSFGQKKALAYMGLMVKWRDIWLLDEPYAGLDKEKKTILREMMLDFVRNGGILIVTSHTEIGFEGFEMRTVAL